MAGLLYITEYSAAGVQNGQPMGVAFANNSISQAPLATSGGSVQSSAFAANTRIVRLHNDSVNICAYKFGTNPTATTGDSRLPANTTEYVAVPQGQSLKVAVILSA